MSEKPLHVQVAEALGWTECRSVANAWIGPEREPVCWHWIGSDPSGREGHIPYYHIEWCATGPLIEKYGISVGPQQVNALTAAIGRWYAISVLWADSEGGETPLIAVCNLLVVLAAEGKLKAA